MAKAVANLLACWVWEFVYIGANWNDKKEKERGHCSKDYQTEQQQETIRPETL